MLSASKIAFMPALALHSAMPNPIRKPKVSLPSLRPAMRVISLAQEVERRAGNDVGDEREMVGDRRRVGEERVDRDAGGDRREQRDQRIEHDAGGERHQPVLLDLMVGADEDVLPAAPGDVHRAFGALRPRPCSRARASCSDSGSIAGFSEPNAASALWRSVVALHGVDHRRRGQDRGRKPGNQAFDAGFGGWGVGHAGAVARARVPRNNHRRGNRLQSAKIKQLQGLFRFTAAGCRAPAPADARPPACSRMTLRRCSSGVPAPSVASPNDMQPLLDFRAFEKYRRSPG